MPQVGLVAVLLLAAALFAFGLYGALARKSAVGILMSLEIMAMALTLNLMGFARFVPYKDMQAQSWFFALFLMVISAAEIGIGLALVVALYRRAHSSEVDDFKELQG